MKSKILIVDDDRIQVEALKILLKDKLNFTVVSAEDGIEAISILKNDTENTIDLVILDIVMPRISGIETLKSIKKINPLLPVIMLTGSNEIEHAVKATQLGAYDFLNKPPQIEKLSVSINNALKIKNLEKTVTQLKSGQPIFRFNDLVGHDGGLKEVVKTGRKAAATDIPVLISGETGAGKELFARALHRESLRADKPFIAVNCGAIPENLVESILFGHEKGSFTGAIAKSIGKFREAQGGTIFLDEIGELPLETQVKLLRVLQQKEVSPIGSEKIIPIDVRIISATNRNLEKEVAAGKFRNDLYFRLNVLTIEIPPLNERPQDIPQLIDFFIKRFSALALKPAKKISPAAIELLCQKEWSGNVREIENAIHRAVVLSESDTLDVEDFLSIRAHVGKDKNGEDNNLNNNFINLIGKNGRLKKMEELEQEIIKFSIYFNKENMTKVARALGMAKSTLYRKIKNSD